MFGQSYAQEDESAEPAVDDSARLPLNELRTFTEIFERIKKAYVEPIDDKELLENAIRGMLDGLDPHSTYLEQDAFDDLQINTRGEFGGLGIDIEMEDGFVKVITPIDDTPAIRAGIQSQDLIIKIGNKAVKGMSMQEAVEKLRGDPGTEVVLTIVRDGETVPMEISVIRDVIKVDSVKSRSLEEGYGYLRITQFQVKTGSDLVKAIEALHEENQPLKGLVLDLRNNPGGVLSAAVEVSDAFLTEGLIVYTQGRISSSEFRYNATAGDPSEGVPIVVLINGGSASASEIVAGALQDHHRGVILGTDSFGKGSVQTILPLNNERALKLTTARYFTPNGRSIQAEGISPDLIIENARLTTVSESPFRVKEANLQGHLTNGQGEEDKQEQGSPSQVDLAKSDFQLYEALNLLKGIDILSAYSEAE